jgi:hypothetical protein
MYRAAIALAGSGGSSGVATAATEKSWVSGKRHGSIGIENNMAAYR